MRAYQTIQVEAPINAFASAIAVMEFDDAQKPFIFAAA
jgi:hypothetical protein